LAELSGEHRHRTYLKCVDAYDCALTGRLLLRPTQMASDNRSNSINLAMTVLVSAASSGQRDNSGGSRLLNKAYFICH
jgi:hypothetical protein